MLPVQEKHVRTLLAQRGWETGVRTVNVCAHISLWTLLSDLSTFKVSCESKAKTLRNTQPRSSVIVQVKTGTLPERRRQRQLDTKHEFRPPWSTQWVQINRGYIMRPCLKHTRKEQLGLWVQFRFSHTLVVSAYEVSNCYAQYCWVLETWLGRRRKEETADTEEMTDTHTEELRPGGLCSRWWEHLLSNPGTQHCFLGAA